MISLLGFSSNAIPKMTGQVVAFSYFSGVVRTGPKLQCHWLVDCSAHLGKSFHFITAYNNIH